ncbi:MAG: hypothetical protein ABH950_03385 [Candidatus Altiarchaeota archaeon]
MVSTPKGPAKIRIELNLDRNTYEGFVRQCSRKGYAPQVIVERYMKKCVETGQM